MGPSRRRSADRPRSRRASGRLYHSDVKRLAFWLPPLVWMAAIMWFSGGDFSAENPGSILRPLVRWLLPGASDAQIAALHALIRKGAHVTEYALLAALWFVALTRERGLSRRRAAWLAFLVAVGWAFLDELHQATEPSRTASATDVAIDATGALAAAAVRRHGGGGGVGRAGPRGPGGGGPRGAGPRPRQFSRHAPPRPPRRAGAGRAGSR